MVQIEFLLPLQGDDADAALIRSTISLAHKHNGVVAAVMAQNNPMSMMAWPSDGSFITASASLMDMATQGNDEAWQKLQATVMDIAKSEPDLTIERLVGPPETLLARRGSLSDVAVFSCESARGKSGASSLFTALLMDARSPVLVLRGASMPSFDKIALAWDGGLEAARAAKASLPFLKSANAVVIMQAPEAVDEIDLSLSDPQRLVTWLARHDITATIENVQASKDPAHDILMSCATLQIDLLVSGAFGHSRARQFIFGGVTRTLVTTTTSPSLLLCH